jgi:peroxiredoxin Q/BCP
VAYYAASVDDAETNRKFAQSLELDYPILSDPTKKTAAAFGVLAYEGQYAARHTIYIGPDGVIAYIDREVNPATAGADTVARLEALGFKPRAKG